MTQEDMSCHIPSFDHLLCCFPLACSSIMGDITMILEEDNKQRVSLDKTCNLNKLMYFWFSIALCWLRAKPAACTATAPRPSWLNAD